MVEVEYTLDALSKRLDDEDKGIAKCDTLGNNQNPFMANEPGLYNLMQRVETKNGKETLQVADKVSEIILFHKKVKRNGLAMMEPFE